MRWVFWLVISAGCFGAEGPLRILFLGNSYTYYNNLAGLVEGMAKRPVEAVSVTRGGATLGELYTATNALEVLRGGRWDLVVLQEQSTLGMSQFNGDFVVNDPGAFFTWARIWDAEIRRQGAHTVFLNTWARKGRAEMQPQMDWAYAFVARELGAGLIPVGTAFGLAGGIDLFQPDGTHPSEAGSYLAACAAVEILTGDGCFGASAEIIGPLMDNATGRLRGERGTLVRLAPEVAATLQTSVLEAVTRLRGEGGYWRLARPVFAGEELAVGGKGNWAGRWEGSTWLYGRKANVTLQLAVDAAACSGTWTVFALEPPTSTVMPLERCAVSADTVQFTVRPLFLTSETHAVRAEGGALQGWVTLQSSSPYHRQAGTWTLQRMTK
jgi:hypothetical protein